jgi:hypothetical protein
MLIRNNVFLMDNRLTEPKIEVRGKLIYKGCKLVEFSGWRIKYPLHTGWPMLSIVGNQIYIAGNPVEDLTGVKRLEIDAENEDSIRELVEKGKINDE